MDNVAGFGSQLLKLHIKADTLLLLFLKRKRGHTNTHIIILHTLIKHTEGGGLDTLTIFGIEK